MFSLSFPPLYLQKIIYICVPVYEEFICISAESRQGNYNFLFYIYIDLVLARAQIEIIKKFVYLFRTFYEIRTNTRLFETNLLINGNIGMRGHDDL